jgi:hypothetical protein
MADSVDQDFELKRDHRSLSQGLNLLESGHVGPVTLTQPPGGGLYFFTYKVCKTILHVSWLGALYMKRKKIWVMEAQ